MKALRLFNLFVFVIWVGLLYSQGNEQFALEIFLCMSGVFVLPALVVVDVIWLIVLAGAGQQAEVTVAVTLTNYLRQKKALGMGDEQINELCRRTGWSETEIQKTHRLLPGESV